MGDSCRGCCLQVPDPESSRNDPSAEPQALLGVPRSPKLYDYNIHYTLKSTQHIFIRTVSEMKLDPGTETVGLRHVFGAWAKPGGRLGGRVPALQA